MAIWGKLSDVNGWSVRGNRAFGGAKNENFKLKLRKTLPLYCFLFDNNGSFLSKVMVENVTSRIDFLFYFLCILLFSQAAIFNSFGFKNCVSQKVILLFSNFHNIS